MAYPYRLYRSAFRRASRRRNQPTSTGKTFYTGGGNWDREVPAKGLGLGPTPNPNKPPYRPGAGGLLFLAIGSVLSPAVLAIAVVGLLASLWRPSRPITEQTLSSPPASPKPVAPQGFWLFKATAALSYLATPVALWQLLSSSKSAPN